MTTAARTRMYDVIATARKADRDAATTERRAAQVERLEKKGKLPEGHVSSEALRQHAAVLRHTATVSCHAAAAIVTGG